MMKLNTTKLLSLLVTALLAGGSGVAVTAWAADTAKHGGEQHDYKSVIEQHLVMAKTPEGQEMLKEAMTTMMAHQMILHDMTTNPKTQKSLEQQLNDPQIKKLVEAVKAEMRDHGKQDAKREEVLKEHKEIMMVVAHAIMKQDREAKALMGETEMEKH